MSAQDRDRVVHPLSYVAYCMHRQGRLRIPEGECLDWLTEFQTHNPQYNLDKDKLLYFVDWERGILKKAGPGKFDGTNFIYEYEFLHSAFQNYFTFCAIRKNLLPHGSPRQRDNIVDRVAELAGRLSSSHGPTDWREPLRLLVSSMDERVDELLLAIATPLANDPPGGAAARASFAVQCLADAENVGDDTVGKLFDLFLERVDDLDGRGMPTTPNDNAVVEGSRSRYAARLRECLVKRYFEHPETTIRGYGGLLAMMGGASVPNDPEKQVEWFEELAARASVEDQCSVAECALLITGA